VSEVGGSLSALGSTSVDLIDFLNSLSLEENIDPSEGFDPPSPLLENALWKVYMKATCFDN